MHKEKTKKQTMAKPSNQSKNQKSLMIAQKLPEDMESEIRDCFAFYDTDKCGYINRMSMRSILGNFGFINKNMKDMEEEIQIDEQKNQFSLNDVTDIINKKWFNNKGREEEIDEIYELFCRKYIRNQQLEIKKIGLNEIKNVFNQYLDIQISDADILEFIQDADYDQDGLLSKQEIAAKLGYI